MDKPNIVFILSDQHNASVMGCSGNAYVKTPNIDKLAQKGTMLTNCYCPSPLCVPSRSAMLAGLLPSETGIYNNMQCLPSDKVTFVHALTVAGYETVLSGRMHFVGPDQRHGYEKRFVGDLTPSFPGMDNEAEIYGGLKRTSNQSRISIEKSGAGSSAVLCFDEDVTNKACNYLKERDDQRPLFMTVGFYGPHCPYISPKELYDYYYATLPEPEAISDSDRDSVHPAIQDWYAKRDLTQVSAAEIRRVRAAYYGMVTFVDNLVGQVVKTVEETIGLENTLIIYASDHGDNIGEHGLFWKTNFYEGAAKVPAIFSWKNNIIENRKVNGLTSLLDLAPTLISASEAPELPKMQGKNLMENLKFGQEIDHDRAIISECGDIKGDNPSAMIRKGDYKLVLHYGYDRPQLFNLKTDPHEKLDLAQDPDLQHLCAELMAELKEYWDPDKAYAQLQNALKHYAILKKWANIVNVAPVDEWRGDVSKNYLLK
jgi:choline-sulfatase